MDENLPRKLPPMAALEFAIGQAFRRYFFGVRLIAGWLIVLAPLLLATYYLALRGGRPDPAALTPLQIAALVVLALAGLLAAVSVAVNWSRRILLDEQPRGWRWLRLDGPVWRYLIALLVFLVIVGGLAGLAALVAVRGAPSLVPKLGPAAQPAANVSAGVTALIAVLVALRLMTRLPAIAVANRAYGFGRAWRTTKRNSLRYLGFLFWLIFGLAIAGGIGAGAVMARKLVADPWVVGGGTAVAAIIGLWIVFLLMTVPVSHYRFFGDGRDFPGSG